MRDLLVRFKEKLECRNSRYRAATVPRLGWRTPGRAPSSPPGGPAVGRVWCTAAGRVLCCRGACWKSLPSCWGNLFSRMCLSGGTLIQNLPKEHAGEAASLWLFWSVSSGGPEECVSSSGAGSWRSLVPSTVSLQRPLLTDLTGCPCVKEEHLEGSDSSSQSRQKG